MWGRLLKCKSALRHQILFNLMILLITRNWDNLVSSIRLSMN